MPEEFVFDETNKIIIHANPNFRKYTIPKNAIKIADGDKTNYVFKDVSKQSETFEVDFEEDSQLVLIGDYAFSSCTQLTKVNFDNAIKLQYIGSFAFSDCSLLTSLNFTNTWSLRGFNRYGAFSSCSRLSSVIFPDKSNVTIIGGGTFRRTGITSFRIPYNCSILNGETFGYCNIVEFTIEPGNTYFCVYKGSIYNYQKTTLVCYASTNSVLELPEETTEIGYLAFEGYPYSLIIPKQIKNYESCAFLGYCGTTLTIMCPPTIIESRLFAHSKIRELYFLDTVSIINENASLGNNQLAFVFFISPITTLYVNSFENIDKICFGGQVDSVQKCLPTIAIKACNLTFIRHRTYDYNECLPLSRYLPFISIFTLCTYQYKYN